MSKVITNKVRASYAHLLTPVAMVEGGQEKYSCSFIIPKSDTETIAKINAAIDAALEEGIAKFGGKKPAKSAIRPVLRDGDVDRPDDPAYANSYFINAKSNDKPQIVDRNLNPILDAAEIYSGMYVRASLSFYAYNVSGSKGVACGLGNIQKLEDGEPLSGRANAAAEFTAVSDSFM
jgi:hypothetical protein